MNEPTDYASLKQRNLELEQKLVGYQNCFDLIDRLQLGEGLTDEQLYHLKVLAVKARAPYAPTSFAMSSENPALANFTGAMRDKLIEARNKGRQGWNDAISFPAFGCAALLLKAVMDGDMVSIANYAMFFHQRGQDGCQAMREQIEASAKLKAAGNVSNAIESTREKLAEIIKRNCSDHLPSCPEAIHQCDWFNIGAVSVLNDICDEFALYDDVGEDA